MMELARGLVTWVKRELEDWGLGASWIVGGWYERCFHCCIGTLKLGKSSSVRLCLLIPKQESMREGCLVP